MFYQIAERMKSKILITPFLYIAIASQIAGQVTKGESVLRAQAPDSTLGWRTGGSLTITMSQTSLTNRASGGQNSIAMNGRLSLFASKKTDDKIDLLSKSGREAFNNFYYALLFNLKTQISPGCQFQYSPDL